MPLKPRKAKISRQEVAQIEAQHQAKSRVQISSGLNASQAERMVKAQRNQVNVQKGEVIGLDLGDKRSEDFVGLGDLDPSQGVIVADPISKKPASIVGKDNYVFNPDGTPTARTAKHLSSQKGR